MATETQQHSPGIWVYKLAQGEVVNSVRSGIWAILNAQGQEIARTTRILPYDESSANARFIIRACNSFEELLAAAEALDRSMGSPKTSSWVRLQAAIAKATSPQAQ